MYSMSNNLRDGHSFRTFNAILFGTENGGISPKLRGVLIVIPVKTGIQNINNFRV